MKKKLREEKGFSLVELIVVIVIILVLSAVLVPNVMQYVKKANESNYIDRANEITKCIKYAETEVMNQYLLTGDGNYNIGKYGIAHFRIFIQKDGKRLGEKVLYYRTGKGGSKINNNAAKSVFDATLQNVSLKGVNYISLVFDDSGNLVQNNPRSDGKGNYYGQGIQCKIDFYDGTTLVYYDEGGWKMQ